MIANSWNTSMDDCPMFILAANLRSFKRILKKCNKEIFRNVHLKVTQTIDEVNMV